MVKPTEEKFEDHFCKKLEDHTYRKRLNKNVDFKFNTDDELLAEFLEKTQKEEIKEIKNIYGKDWLKKIKDRVQGLLEKNKLFEVLKEGIKIESVRLKLIYFKPETTYNQEQFEKYKSNIFSYVRQFHFRESQESIDVVIFLNGFALITIELKSPFRNEYKITSPIHPLSSSGFMSI